MTADDQASQSKQPDLHGVPFLTKVIATGLFSGYIPWASGTFGSLVGILMYAFIPGFENPLFFYATILIVFAAGVYTSGQVAASVGHHLTATAALTKAAFQPGPHDIPDPSIVVVDEIVGMWISLLFLPTSIVALISAFFFFRIFDIVKPPPAQQLEKIPGGWGIMLDDVIAGIYANIASHALLLGLHFLLPATL